MLTVALSALLMGLAVCHPSESIHSYEPISEQDREFLRTLPAHRTDYPAGFKVVYLAQDGSLHDYPPSGYSVKVVGSPGASAQAVRVAAGYATKMLKHSPSQVFHNLANHHSGIGLFREYEKLTIFPEYASLRDTPECRGRCDGACARTCTFDGRKWDTVAGAGGALAVVEEENVMCYSNDPYRHHDNICVHEFAHVVDHYGFDSRMKQMKIAAFNYARSHNLWRASAYSMSNSAEYFGEATGAFFMVNKQSSPGGMNECYGYGRYCPSEMEAREHLRQRDPQLYDLLVLVYTSNQPSLPSGLTVCPSG